MGRTRITSSKREPARGKRLAEKSQEWKSEYSIDFCRNDFIVKQITKDNSKATVDFYNRFFKKFAGFIAEVFDGETLADIPIDYIGGDVNQPVFMKYLEAQGLGKQTVNSYLRGLRAFGNFCQKEGYIETFECPIKEVAPPVKQVYTDKELAKLMVKPKVEEFAEFRTYCMISLILNTGARSNTLLNIRISDVDLDEGYVAFNTTKAHKVVRLGLDKKTKRDLTEWISFWRIDKDAGPDDYLFCNEYGEQLSRSALTKSFRIYNHRRGVEKTSIHLLRHTFAKKWITSGGDVITLAKVLTHSELEMVQRYANLYGTDVKKEIEEHSAIAQMKTASGKTLKNRKRLMDE